MSYANRGYAFNALNLYELALNDFDSAIAINPNPSIAYEMRSIANLSLKRFDFSLQDCIKAVELLFKSIRVDKSIRGN